MVSVFFLNPMLISIVSDAQLHKNSDGSHLQSDSFDDLTVFERLTVGQFSPSILLQSRRLSVALLYGIRSLMI